MSNEINNRMYAFLAQYNKNGESWAKYADKEVGNGDEILSKNEFTKFVNQFSQEFNKEDIDTFWSECADTNKNGYLSKAKGIKNLGNLDAEELKNMDKGLEIYVKLEEFIDKNVKGKAPNVLLATKSKWETDVAQKLRNLVASSVSAGEINNVDKFLNDAFKIYSNETTAECCVKEISDQLNNVGVLRGYNHDLSQDEYFAEHIATYCANIDANSATPQSIKDDITNIINSYLKTANLSQEGDYEGFGYQTNGLNPLQTAVVTKKITNELQGLASKYSEYANYFTEAVTTFVNGKVGGAVSFDEFSTDSKIKELAEEFKTSGLLDKLDTAINITEKYQKNIGDDFKKELSNLVGENVAKMVLDDLDGRYSTIIDTVVQGILNDTIKGTDAAKSEILKQVKLNFANFLPDDLENYDLDELKNINNGALTAATSLKSVEKDSSGALNTMRNSAIKICDALVKKGAEYAQMVYESKFGRDYETTINSMTSIDNIKSVLDSIIEKSGKTEAAHNMTATITGGPDANSTLITNSSARYQINTTFQRDGVNEDVDPSEVSYALKTTSNAAIGYVTIDDFGNINVRSGSQNGYIKFSVNAVVNGITVEPAQNFSVMVKSTTDAISSATWGAEKTSLPGKNSDYSDGDGGLRIWGGNGDYNDKSLKDADISFADLYNGNYNIELGTSAHSDGNKYAKEICDRLYDLGRAVVTALSNQGLDKTKLTQAMQTVTKKWSDNITDVGKLASKGCNKSDQREKSDSTYNKLSTGYTNGEYSGITRGQDTKGNDQKVYMINFKEYVDAILAEYNSLI